MFEITDNDDEALRLLKQIAQNTGSIEGGGTDISIKGQNASSRVGLVSPRDYTVIESDQLEAANPDGTITLQPGESKTIVRFGHGPFAILAVGASDEPDVRYQLRADNEHTIGGSTNSPLGLVNSPFSFVDTIGGAVPVETVVEYVATLDSSASSSVDLVARLHVEAL